MEEELRQILLAGSTQMGIDLPPEAIPRFAALLSLLQLWGRRINLTTHLEGKQVVIHHFLDSLAGARFLAHEHGARVVDLGAGAGFPAFPLKFALPSLRFTLVESVRKKISFCREVIRMTGSVGIEAICSRGEELAGQPGQRRAYAWAVSRALGKSAAVLRLAVPLLAPGGGVIIYKGLPEKDELDELERSCGEIGASWHLHEVEVPGLKAKRSLIVARIAGA